MINQVTGAPMPRKRPNAAYLDLLVMVERDMVFLLSGKR
jgi:hypothetical protein